MNLRFIPHWKALAPKLWSVRLTALAAVLSGIEFSLPFIAPDRRSGVFALAALLVSVAACFARFIAQPKAIAAATGPKDTTS